ncbi:Zinc finger CCCH domain-containing protein 62 [Acorus gramineus]|uniref:Zinc finger CCCH domain-containing protein 62 n=1 Tax=Acorus gramineus TaxID=55184 RepID=A0AAV9BPR0_ACOGR|nr:Zinc finger CCCH domain-containing protein 62 [Acorus gramineus]
MASAKGKGFVVISSSSSSSASSESEEDDDQVIDVCSSDVDDRSESDTDELSDSTPSDRSVCDRVIRLLQRGDDLRSLKLGECKAYLRVSGLRISGCKEVCVQRIQEHWREMHGDHGDIMNNDRGNCATGYPVIHVKVTKNFQGMFVMVMSLCSSRGYMRSMFRFDIKTRGGGAKIIGKRTIAGRVVKESYGAAKQQHTFTVSPGKIEILWCKGVKSLPPLFPLLVKGRNLYRLKTFRQRWNNESERSKVLDEKHKRGAAARRTRERAKARSRHEGSKHQRRSRTRNTASPNRRMKKEIMPATRKREQNVKQGRALSVNHGNMKRAGKPRPRRSFDSYHTQRSFSQDVHHQHLTQMQPHHRDHVLNILLAPSGIN